MAWSLEWYVVLDENTNVYLPKEISGIYIKFPNWDFKNILCSRIRKEVATCISYHHV